MPYMESELQQYFFTSRSCCSVAKKHPAWLFSFISKLRAKLPSTDIFIIASKLMVHFPPPVWYFLGLLLLMCIFEFCLLVYLMGIWNQEILLSHWTNLQQLFSAAYITICSSFLQLSLVSVWWKDYLSLNFHVEKFTGQVHFHLGNNTV